MFCFELNSLFKKMSTKPNSQNLYPYQTSILFLTVPEITFFLSHIDFTSFIKVASTIPLIKTEHLIQNSVFTICYPDWVVRKILPGWTGLCGIKSVCTFDGDKSFEIGRHVSGICLEGNRSSICHWLESELKEFILSLLYIQPSFHLRCW